MSYNIILNTTTFCNYNCSYCDVIKSKKNISKEVLENLLTFINKNKTEIKTFKFFGGEPLLAFDNIKYIIDNSHGLIGTNFKIVTNTSILNDKIGEYFNKYFSQVFFSIDTQNDFNFQNVNEFINKYNLRQKLYFNLIIIPGKEFVSLDNFKKLYELGYKQFNILPVYYTKPWTKQNLEKLSKVMKEIFKLTSIDNQIKLYGFQENLGEESNLINKSFFIDVDGLMYYSDIVASLFGKTVKNALFLGKLENIILKDFQEKKFSKQQQIISKTIQNIYNEVPGQKQLNKMINYFSVYLNRKNGR